MWPGSVKTLDWHIKGDVEGYAISAPYEGIGNHAQWAGLWAQHGGVHGLGFWSLPGYYTLGIGGGSDVGEGSGQLALEDASSNSVG